MTGVSSKYYSTKDDRILRIAEYHLYWGKEIVKLRKRSCPEIIGAGEEISLMIMRSYRSEKIE